MRRIYSLLLYICACGVALIGLAWWHLGQYQPILSAPCVVRTEPPKASAAPSLHASPAMVDAPAQTWHRWRGLCDPYGARTLMSFRAATERDPVLQRYYKEFRWDLARMSIVTEDTLRFVSYRHGDGIKWTRRPLVIHKGERIITDGIMTIRGYCCNEISITPHGPLAPIEPPYASINIPPGVPIIPFGRIPGIAVPPPYAPPLIPPYPVSPGVLYPAISVSGSGGEVCDIPSAPQINGMDAPLPTPEPSTFVLFCIGICVCACYNVLKRHRDTIRKARKHV
jgi:hypothetical protein